MSKAFRKAALRTGTYHSPDGVVEVTPERLRHWSQQFNAMTKAKQVVPMHWDHGNDLESLQPIAMDAFNKKLTRSAANSVGKLSKFEVSDDGESATLEFVTLTPSATEKVEANAVYVSPVIFPSWKDGTGKTYTDVITHVDLVNHPVDHSQGPAVPVEAPALMSCIRMGADSAPYKLEEPADNPDVADEGNHPEPDGDEEPTGEDQSLVNAVAALASFGLVLPNDTTPENFIDRVMTAAIAAAGTDPSAGGLQPPGDTTPTQQQGVTVSQPQIATMSLEAQRALEYGERQHRATVKQSLDALLESGRCTPAEYAAQEQLVGALKLSLNEQGEPSQSSVESWIAAREPVPAGSFWDGEEKLKRMSAEPSKHPSAIKFGANGEPSQEEIDEAVSVLTRRS